MRFHAKAKGKKIGDREREMCRKKWESGERVAEFGDGRSEGGLGGEMLQKEREREQASCIRACTRSKR